MDDFPVNEMQPLTTKSSLADILKCSVRSIYNYSELAQIFVDDFIADYPKVESKIVTSYPLTTYQCWVIFRIYQFLKQIPKSEVLKHQLENNPAIQAQYSKAKFYEIYPEYKENNNDGSSAICK